MAKKTAIKKKILIADTQGATSTTKKKTTLPDDIISKPVPTPVKAPVTSKIAPTIDLTESKPKQTIVEKVATAGLKPSVAIGNVVLGGIEAVTGKTYERSTAQEMAATPAGKVLGTAIVATAVAASIALASIGISAAFTKTTVVTASQTGSIATIIRTATQISKNPLSMTTQKAFQGMTMNPAVNKIFLSTARVASNVNNVALKTSYLTKLAATATNPIAVLGLLGTTLYTSLFWAPNEKGDALMTLSILQAAAVKAGDMQSVQEIADLIKETADISANIPVIGFMKAELAKFKAAKKASEVYKRIAERQVEEANERAMEPTFAEQSQEVADTRREQKLREREQDTRYYNRIAKEKRERELKERAEDDEYWRLIQENNYSEAAIVLKKIKYEYERKSNLNFGLL